MSPEFIEGWVFVAIGKGTNLTGVISSGDIYNKAIFNQDEIEYGVSRLLARHLIEANGNNFRPTPAGLSLQNRLKTTWYHRITELEAEFKATPITDTPEWKLEHAAYLAAIESYQKSWQ